MNLDEEEPPPLLVDVEGTEEENVAEKPDIKVPITIVTGKHIAGRTELYS